MLMIPLCCGGWLWLDGPQSTIDVAGPVAEAQRAVFYRTVVVTGVIFVIVAAVLAYATLKFKARSEEDEHAPPPPQGHGNPLVEISLIGASILALVFIAIPTLQNIWYTYEVPEAARANAVEVKAIGKQWWFKFEYPNVQIEGAGPLTTANEVVIPTGRPVHIDLRSDDVIHSFWVPKLAGKVDMIPNRGNHLWLQADKAGYYWGQCAEYCGESHAVMRFRVIALDQPEYDAWLAHQEQGARTVAAAAASDDKPHAEFAKFTMPPRNTAGWSPEFDKDPLQSWKDKQQVPAAGTEDVVLIAKGRELFAQKTCAGCHTVRGHGYMGATAPDLTHVGSRTTIAGGLVENNTYNLHRWITDPENVKPGNKMYMGVPMGGGTIMPGYMMEDAETGDLKPNPSLQLSPDEVDALVAYVSSLK